MIPSANQMNPSSAMTPAQSDALWEQQFAESVGALNNLAQTAQADLINVPYSDSDAW